MNKEKSKNKNKTKQNKNPLPKIKSNNNLPLKTKNNKYIQDSKNNNDLEHLKINYQKEQKQVLPKTNLRMKNINSKKNSNVNTNIKNKSKTGLKYLLKEYGLVEYHKKLNELGYNNNNYVEIGNLTKKNLVSLINTINILPLHYEKMEKFYEYLRKMNHNNNANNKKINQKLIFDRMSSTTPQFPKRRFNFNLNHSNNFNLNNNENTKTNQIYNQYQNYYNNYIEPNHYNNNHDIDIYTNINRRKYNRKSLNINREIKKQKYYKAKSRPRPHTSNPKLYYNKNNNYNNNHSIKIRIRNNYSGKKIMKKKLKNFALMNSPYLSNSIDDNSSLIKSYFNDYRNLAENHKMNLVNQNMNIIDIDRINTNDNKIKNNNSNEKNILYKSQNNYLKINNQNDFENGIDENIERMLNLYMVQLNEKLDKSFDSIEDSSLSHVITGPMDENQNQNEKILPNYKLPKIKKEEEIKLNEIELKGKKIINNNENEKIIKEEAESSKDLKRLSAHDTSTKSKDSKEQPIEELLEEKKYITKEEAAQLLPDIEYNFSDKKFSLEQNIYETLRLNKSFDEENNKKETIKFDIEFICRCLGLAIMKYIEQGQEKEHITELYDKSINNKNKYNFFFLNEEFNDNIFLLEEFFDIENNKNNNEKENKLLGDMNIIPILEQLDMKKGEINKVKINILSHLKKKGDENYIIKEDNVNKLQNDLLEVDKELKFLGHYFSYKRTKVKDYQGLSENTKKILGKDLSYIKEIDSEINHTGSKGANNSESKLSKSNINNNDNNSLYNDSKNNQENMNKILDDSGEYEDEFLKEKCVDDLNINSNFQKGKEEENEEEIITSKYKNSDISNKDDNKISLRKIPELPPNQQDIESSYIIEAKNIQEFKLFLLSKLEVFDEDYIFNSNSIPAKRLMQSPDPQTIFEFCANIMLLTKMEKEVIIVALIYIERLIFNTGLLLTSRNWRKLIFTALIISSKIWDDDSLENIHFSQIFSHLKIGEINLLERNFMEMINYKVFVKFSEFMKYYLSVKNMCLKYNYNGEKIVGIKPDKIIRIQEYRYQLQKRMSKTMNLNNSASF